MKRFVKPFLSFFSELAAERAKFEDIQLWWDWVKERVAEWFQKVSIKKAKERREKNARLVSQLHFLFKCKALGLDVEEEIQQVRMERNKDLRQRGKEIIFRAKVRDMEEGEKCTQQFFKKALNPRGFFSAIESQGREVKGEEMKEEIRLFYFTSIEDMGGSGRGD